MPSSKSTSSSSSRPLIADTKKKYKRLRFQLNDVEEGEGNGENNDNDNSNVDVDHVDENPQVRQSRLEETFPSKSRFRRNRTPLMLRFFCITGRRSALLSQILFVFSLIVFTFYLFAVYIMAGTSEQDLELEALTNKNEREMSKMDAKALFELHNPNLARKRNQNQNMNPNRDQNQNPNPTIFSTNGKVTGNGRNKSKVVHTEFWPKIRIMRGNGKNDGYISKTISTFQNLARGLVGLASGTGTGDNAGTKGDKWEPCTTPELFEIQTELTIPVLYGRIPFEIVDSAENSTEGLNGRQGASSSSETSTSGTTMQEFNDEPIQDLTKDKLKIFVVLHSHNDAGWSDTFESYYAQRTKKILDNILTHLTADPQLKFIWSETCFLDLWWSDIGKEKQSQVKKLVANGQLEFVGGGWVMPDEATPHYLSIVTQLIEGHQWLQQHLNYTPINGWKIDPFGLSSSSTFLQQRAGFKNTVFSRIPYKLRELLNQEKKAEFYWRQPWDAFGNTDMFCYQMPYGSYDAQDTCGATEHSQSFDCLMYSSKRPLKGMFGDELQNRSREEEIAARARILLTQYRKKSKLFRTKNLLMPIGGDFAWQSEYEWTDDIKNLKDIFKHVNSEKVFNAEIKFATLNEYFEATQKDLREKKFSSGTEKIWKPSVFSGDFFTYADKGEEYWSGYYTSRIFHKTSERQLMTLVRSSQLIYTLMAAEVTKVYGGLDFSFVTNLLEKIMNARRTLSLFQHHDGITGTSANNVVRDYAVKLFRALYDSHSVIQQCIHILQSIKLNYSTTENLTELLKEIKSDDVFYTPIMNKTKSEALWEDEVHNVHWKNPEETIIVFNPLAKPRKQLVRIRVSHSDVKVVDSNKNEVSFEIYPIFKYFNKYYQENNQQPPNNTTKSEPQILTDVDHFELFFLAEFRQLGLKTFRIIYERPAKRKAKKANETRVHVEVYNTKTNFSEQFQNTFDIDMPKPTANDTGISSSKNKVFYISNHHFAVRFNENGTAVFLKMKETVYQLKITFSYYKTNNKSGLYVFIPEGKDIPVELMGIEPVIIMVSGKLRSYVEVWYPTVRHRLTLLNHDGLESYEIHVDNILDIRNKTDYELIMKISTEIKSDIQFFTDSNGFQMMRRENRDYLPIQGNYYPIASSAFIEDRDLRLTVLAAQPGGCASLAPGQLEIMLDRRIDQDDGKGIGEGGTDNLETISSFKLIFEKPSAGCNPRDPNTESGSSGSLFTHYHFPLPLLSFDANLQQLNFLHPLLGYRRVVSNGTSKRTGIQNRTLLDYSVGIKPMPCDIHLMGAMPLLSFSDSDEKEKSEGDDDGDARVFFTSSNQSALLFHRMGIDGRFSSNSKQLLEQCALASDSTNELADSKSSNQNPFSFGQLRVKDVFGDLFKEQMLQTSLSLSRKHRYYNGSETLGLEPMEIYSLVVDYDYFVETPGRK